MLRDFFYGIEDLFETILIFPMNDIAKLELENWWIANSATWLFVVIGIVAFVYWMGQLKKFNDNNEENKTISSHSFL
ncbi:MAG: uracil phosphoribosyltransferase [Flavobacteriaceae bacterium]|nr:uracil phosphoribosyltransferase [Flavobacteriaceae bacterium]